MTSPHDMVPPAERLRQLCTGSWIAQAIYAAAKLGLADLLMEGPKPCTALAEATGTDPTALFRLLRALSSVGVFEQLPDDQFRLTPLAECLNSKPGSQRAMAIMMGEEHYLAWGEILYSLKTGKVAFDKIFGSSVFDFLAHHADKAAIFDEAMTGVHGAEYAAMLEAYDFNSIQTLADVGGGNGTLLRTIMQRYPHMHGILFDLEHVVERARQNPANASIIPRCRFLAGSFFDSVPSGADAILMRHIIHDWTDEQCHAILKNCRNALCPGGRVLIVESVIPPGNDPNWTKFLDLNMMIIPGGKERTKAEFTSLLHQAGFQLERIVPTRIELSIIVGRLG